MSVEGGICFIISFRAQENVLCTLNFQTTPSLMIRIPMAYHAFVTQTDHREMYHIRFILPAYFIATREKHLICLTVWKHMFLLLEWLIWLNFRVLPQPYIYMLAMNRQPCFPQARVERFFYVLGIVSGNGTKHTVETKRYIGTSWHTIWSYI